MNGCGWDGQAGGHGMACLHIIQIPQRTGRDPAWADPAWADPAWAVIPLGPVLLIQIPHAHGPRDRV